MAGKVLMRYSGKETYVSIPEGTTEIYGEAFINCKHVTQVCVPEGVTHIGWGAFSGSGLKEVYLPSTLIHIAAHAFDETPWINSLSKSGQPEYVYGGKILLRYNSSDPVVHIPDGMGYSYNYASHLFRRCFPMEFCETVNMHRLEEAARLLKENPKSMINVADKAGFSTIRGFNSAFKKRFSVTPS